VGGLVAIGAIFGFFATRAASSGPTSAEVQAAASSAASTLAARSEVDSQLLATASASINGDPAEGDARVLARLDRLASNDRTVGVARVTPSGTVPVVVAVPDSSAATIVGTDLAGTADARLVLELARDGDQSAAVVTTGSDGKPVVIDALPLYGTPDPPSDIGGRRSALRGYVVTVTPVAALVGLSTGRDEDIAVRVLDGATVLDAQGRDLSNPPASPVAESVTANGVPFIVQAWATPSPSALPWVVLAVGLALAVAVAVIVYFRERSAAAAQADLVARNEELALIARAGPLLQQSLAMGELLPVFVVEVGAELALDGISVSLATPSGGLEPVFSLGTRAGTPTPALASLVAPPTSVRPGELVIVPLQRAGRVVGTLQARAVTGLTEPQMETLLGVCALLAAAIGNVRMFQDEQDMVARLRDIDSMKTSFIGSVSHELRTSVTAIQGFAALLEANPGIDAEHRADYLERIARNARSLAALIEDLLDFARFERVGLTVDLHPVDLSDLVPTIVDQLSSVLGGRAVSTVIEPNVTALADPQAIERVLANLLSNASKYTPPDSKVIVGLERTPMEAVLYVDDDGPGIAPDEREKIFELFYRSDSTARTSRGVGIGLALVRQLVVHLNGTIDVEDARGGGARFRVTIPLAEHEEISLQHPEPARTPLGTGG
jgi:signal transduction histidine kinase